MRSRRNGYCNPDVVQVYYHSGRHEELVVLRHYTHLPLWNLVNIHAKPFYHLPIESLKLCFNSRSRRRHENRISTRITLDYLVLSTSLKPWTKDLRSSFMILSFVISSWSPNSYSSWSSNIKPPRSSNICN